MDSQPICLLMLAVLQEQDLDTATRTLEHLGAPVVYLASVGGFLGRRSATLLIGLPEKMEEKTLQVLQKSCRQRVEFVASPLDGTSIPLPQPAQVTIGGATIFTFEVEFYDEF